MFRRTLVSAAAATALVALTFVPAEAASYTVTATTPASADVGKTFKVTGAVTGSGKAKKTLLVQRKVGSAAWKTYTTVKTDAQGKFARSVKVSSVGAKKYRVVAPAKGSVKQGVSPTRTVTGYTWLPLVDQSFQVFGGSVATDVTAKVGSTSYPRSFLITEGSGDSLSINFRTNGHCNLINLGYGIDSRFSGTTGYVVGAGGYDVSGSSFSQIYADATSSTTHAKRQAAIDPRVDLVYLYRGSSGSSITAFTTPKVHCSVTELPEWDPTVAF